MPDPRKPRRPLSRADWAFVALAVMLAAGLAGAWFWHRSAGSLTELPAITAAQPGETLGSSRAAPSGSNPTVSPDQVRSLLEPVSSHPLFRGWLGEADLVRRWVVVTDNLAEGVSPRKQLGFLAPSRPFTVTGAGKKKTAIDPESYRRYDGFAEVVATLDVPALAKAYRELHPVLEAAYRALGYPDALLDRVTARALSRIEAVPVRDGEVLVERQGQDQVYVFADPLLEGLGGVEKHLLRMGPRNTRLLQAKAHEIREALRLPATTAARGGP